VRYFEYFLYRKLLIISHFFFIRTEIVAISWANPRFLLWALPHPTVTAIPTPPGSPITTVWLHYLETSIAHAFPDGVRLLCCHVALTRVHDRSKPPPATLLTSPISTAIQPKPNMVQDSFGFSREIYFIPPHLQFFLMLFRLPFHRLKLLQLKFWTL